MSDYLFSLFVALLLIAINHSELNHIVLSELPCFTLDSQRFLKITGDIITSPERRWPTIFSTQHVHWIKVFYDQTIWNFFFFFLRDKKASWLFFNGLRKNLTSLEDARLTVKGTPEIIAISERKLKFIILAYRGMFFRLLIHEQVQEVWAFIFPNNWFSLERHAPPALTAKWRLEGREVWRFLV